MVPILAALLPVLGNVLDRVIPDKAEAERAKQEIAAQIAEAEIELSKKQMDLAIEDAKSGKGGFRWGAGWLCIVSLGYSWLIQPLLVWATAVFAPDIVPPPALGVTEQYAMLTGMLGLAGVRSFDLSKGTRR